MPAIRFACHVTVLWLACFDAAKCISQCEPVMPEKDCNDVQGRYPG